ncbi:GTP cyclohydrolase [Mycobacterium sp. IS-1590]|uniref:YciI family protein n=1 Tax=Mycobacterium sp. IS-1590 TaxID=1772286 RepID=UPI0007467051|nr:YciI family protein [Mycobacterium sp. IS-1590]KUI43745.1 GTP cyclohydrolase [Mycobacterium sp. IS-1590]
MFHVLKSTYLQPPEVVNQTRPAHLEWLKDEVGAGRIVLAGRLEDESGAVLITGDMDAEQAQDIVDRDPYTAAGVARYERLSFNGAFRAAGL